MTPKIFLKNYFRFKDNNWLYWDIFALAFTVYVISFSASLPDAFANLLFVFMIVAMFYWLMRFGIFAAGFALSFQGINYVEALKNQRAKVEKAPKSVEEYATNEGIKQKLGWFTAIAVFSLLNSLFIALNFNVNFLIGLGSVSIITVLAKTFVGATGNTIFIFVAIILNIIFALFFIKVAQKGREKAGWVYTGIGLYAIDSILNLLFKDYLGFAFHLFVLAMILPLIKALRQQKNKAE